MTKKLLIDVRKFVDRHGITPSTFGKLAVNDGKFISRLDDGGRIWPETEHRVRSFMRKFRKKNRASLGKGKVRKTGAVSVTAAHEVNHGT